MFRLFLVASAFTAPCFAVLSHGLSIISAAVSGVEGDYSTETTVMLGLVHDYKVALQPSEKTTSTHSVCKLIALLAGAWDCPDDFVIP